MAGDTFSQSPLDAFVAEQEAGLANVGSSPVEQQPSLTGRLTPRLRTAFEQISTQTNVPVNILMAIASRDSDFDQFARKTKGVPERGIIRTSRVDDPSANPFVPEEAIGIAAGKIRQAMDAGATMPEIIRQFARDDDPDAYSSDVMQRALAIGKELYPDAFAPARTNADLYDERNAFQRNVSDRLRSGGAGVVSGHGANMASNAAAMMQVMDRIDAGEDVREVDDPLGYAHMSPDQKQAAREHLAQNMAGNVSSMAAWEEYRRAIPYDENVAKAAKAETFGEFWDGFSANPLKFIAHITMESLPAMAPGMATGGVVGMARGGAAAVAGAMGASSYAVDMGASIIEALSDRGVDVANPEEVEAALADPETLKEVREAAHAHASAVGAFDGAAGMGIGKVAEKAVGKGFWRGVGTLAKEGAKEIPAQAALGMAGELSGQVASGDDIKVGAVLAEGFGEIGGTAGGVGAVAAGRAVGEGVRAAKGKTDAPAPEAAPDAPAPEQTPPEPADASEQTGAEPAPTEQPAPAPVPEAATPDASTLPPGSKIRITDEDGTHDATVVEDIATGDDAGLEVVLDGSDEKLTYSKEEINSGAVRIEPMGGDTSVQEGSVPASAEVRDGRGEVDRDAVSAPAEQAKPEDRSGGMAVGGMAGDGAGAAQPELTKPTPVAPWVVPSIANRKQAADAGRAAAAHGAYRSPPAGLKPGLQEAWLAAYDKAAKAKAPNDGTPKSTYGKPKQAPMESREFDTKAGVGKVSATKYRHGEGYGVAWASTHIADAATMEEAAAIAERVAASGADNIEAMRAVAQAEAAPYVSPNTEALPIPFKGEAIDAGGASRAYRDWLASAPTAEVEQMAALGGQVASPAKAELERRANGGSRKAAEPNLEAAKALIREQKEATGNPKKEAAVRKKVRDLAAKTPETDDLTWTALDIAATRLGMGEGGKKGIRPEPVKAKAEAPKAETKQEVAPKAQPASAPAMTYEQHIARLNDRASKFGKSKIREEAISARASIAIGRGFGQSVEDYLKANPALAEKDRAYRDWLEGYGEGIAERAKAEAEKADTKPAHAPNDVHPDWATAFEADTNGRVVYSDDEVALIQGFSVLTGNPVYAGISKANDSRTTVDIERYTGGVITAEQKARLVEAKKRVVAEDDAAHKKRANGPFADGERFAASEGVPAGLASTAREWLGMLGIDARVFLVTVDEARTTDGIAKYGLSGPFAAVRSAGIDNGENGSVRRLSNGDYYIALKLRSRMSANLETMAHEIGHIVEREAFNSADTATREAILQTWRSWVEGAGNTKADDWVRSLRSHVIGKLTFVQGNTGASLPPYWRSFSEWFADQVAKWAVSEERPRGVVEQFFARIGAALRRLYASAAGQKSLPTQTMRDYLNSRAETFAPVAAPASTKPEKGASNKIFTADAAEKARALLKSKLNQINSGIDPEILQAGITLAGYHIEAGARSFAAYAKAMLDDLGEVARPYLKSWYMGVKYDPRAAGFDGMSSAAEVDAADVNTITDKAAADDVQKPSGARSDKPSGTVETVTTPAGREFQVRHKVVEAADLIASNDETGAVNPAYPKELQPRDRSRSASQDQINDIASRLNPRLLGGSTSATDGAPIVSPDNVVESGNGRTLALRTAYARGQADAYRQWLTSQGYDVDGMTAPVLVRERITPMTMDERIAYTGEANERTTLEMSSTERAVSDARKIGDILHLYRGGDMNTAGNRDFVREFVGTVAAKSDRGRILDGDGMLSQDGRRRIEAALLARAYEDSDLVTDLFESGDSDIKAIGGALLDAAGDWAKMRQAIADGTISPDVDLTKNLMGAVNLVRRARAEGKTMFEMVNQNDIFSGGLDPATEWFAKLFYRGENLTRARGRDKVAEDLRFYTEQAAHATPDDNLFGDPAVTGRQILEATHERRKRKEEAAAGQQELSLGPATPGERAGSGGETGQPAVSQTGSEEAPQGGLNVPGPDERVERDRENAADPSPRAGETDGNAAGRNAVDAGSASEGVGAKRRAGQRDNVVSDDGAAAVREGSNLDVYQPDGQLAAAPGVARSDERGGSSSDRAEGSTVDAQRKDAIASDAGTAGAGDLASRQAAQKKAAGTPTKWRDKASIDAALPLLLPAQRDDVLKAEKRLEKHNGILFTNGTGTGKTASGLGIALRFANAGKNNILVVVPSDKIASDWVKFASMLGMDLKMLADTKDNGKSGPVITTYANFGQNAELTQRDWDLVITDESHYLSSNEKGGNTASLDKLRALTGHHAGFYNWVRERFPKEWGAYEQAMRDLSDASGNLDIGPDRYAVLEANERRAGEVWKPIEKRERAAWDKRWETQEGLPKTVMLSATPFAYAKSVDYAEGYLFHYIDPKNRAKEDQGSLGYNVPDAREQFMITHFGYRMRYNRLTAPEAGVNSEVMEQQFNERLKQKGALSGRRLEVDHDYDRKFVLIDDAAGRKLDELMRFLVEAEDGKYRDVYDALREHFDYQSRMYLLEAMKARSAVPMIREHLKLGRKVVLFHDFNKGGAVDPLENTLKAIPDSSLRARAAAIFSRPEFKIDFSNLHSPVATMQEAFPDALFFNGTVPKAKRREAADLFNDDNSGRNLIVVQSDAGREGVSLHDTTGRHQRVEINLGMPVKPVAATQIEGRIYRTGQASDAIFRYLTTGTAWETAAFASKIAERASTAENLALGDEARGLKESFIDAYQNAAEFSISPDEGKGGKAYDRNLSISVSGSPFGKAKTFYWANQKNTRRRDQREGTDYYATPEPVGFKMVEWAGVKPNDKVLEPSAGHGAIARFLPAQADVTMVEPSYDLSQRAALSNGTARIVNDRFENLHVSNKFDAIIMNPPYGKGGSTSTAHLAKAVKHLRVGGRIVALLPRGGRADVRLQEFLDGESATGLHVVARIAMPAVTFERAGTSVNTQIIVLDKYASAEAVPDSPAIASDLSSADSVNDLFDRIENMALPDRPSPGQEGGDGQAFEIVEHVTKKGKTLRGAIRTDLSMDEAKEIDPYSFRKRNKDGQVGWFIREKHLSAAGPVLPSITDRSTAFDKWFGDSKVVDADGKPLVVYHGRTGAVGGVADFDTGPRVGYKGRKQSGAFFSADREYAEGYAEDGAVVPVYLSIQNPFVTSDNPSAFNEERMEKLKAEGYDGLIWNDPEFGDFIEVIAFHPGQIKSVNNRGNWNPNDANILESITDRLTSQTADNGVSSDKLAKISGRITRLLNAAKKGNIDEAAFASELSDAIQEQRRLRSDARFEKAVRGRERGADIVREKLLAARRRGQTDPDGVDIVLWALDRNPAMADDLAISIRENKNPDDMTAAFYNGANMITLFKDKADAETAIHEILHHTERMMKPRVREAILNGYARAFAAARRKASPEIQALMDDMLLAQSGDKAASARVLKAFHDGPLNRAEHYQFVSPSEWWAVNGALLMSERHAARGNVWALAKQWLKEFVQHVRQVLRLSSTSPVIRGLNAILSGDHTPPTGRNLSDGSTFASIKESRQDSTHDTAQPSRMDMMRERLSTILPTMMTGGGKGSQGLNAMAAVPVRALFKELFNGSKTATAYTDIKQEMDTYRNDVQAMVHELTSKWLKYAKKHKDEAQKLSDLMHESTIAQVDPSKPYTPGRQDSDVWALANSRLPNAGKALDNYLAREAERSEAYAPLRKQWEALSDEGKALYVEVRDAYAKLDKERQEGLVENIKASLEYLVKQAERRHAAEVERLKGDSSLSAADLAKAIDAADKELQKVRGRQRRAQASRAKELRRQFEATRLEGPYFPLARFGSYFVTVKDDDGHIVSFSRFESLTQMNRFARQMRARGFDVRHGVLNNDESDANQVSPEFVSRIDQMIVENGGDHFMRDALWQEYLKTLPDFSMRKSSIHREGTPGYHKDALRSFASTAFHSSHQIARLKYGMQLQNLLAELEVEARNAADPVRAMATWKEMNAAHQFLMNPVVAPVAQTVTSAVFLFYMGARLSSAMVNLEQFISKGVPILAHNTGLTEAPVNVGYRTAMRETARAVADVSRGLGSAEKSKRLTPEERHALKVGYEGGTIDRTMAHDVAGVSEVGVEYNHTRHMVMQIASAPMHHTERVNREVTYLAAFRIARANGRSVGEAIAFAKDMTWATHYDNQSTSKPRMMRSSLGRMVFALRSFLVNTLWRLGRDIHQAFKGESKEVREAAGRRFAGMFAATALLAGFKGAIAWNTIIKPAASVILSMFGMLGNDDDLDELLRRKVMHAAREIPGATAIAGMMFDGIPGYLAGIDLSGRIGMADLFIQGGGRDQAGASGDLQNLLGILGPAASLAYNLNRGAGDILSGDVWRGLERVSPAVVRDQMKAIRYATDGVENKAGDIVLENVPVQDLVKQSLGFTPARVAEAFERGTYKYNMTQRIKDMRRDALKAFEKSGDDMDTSKIVEFNRLYPDYAITSNDAKNYVTRPFKRERLNHQGVQVPARLQNRALEQSAPMLYNRQE